MEKIKQFVQSNSGKDILTIIIIILLGLMSFGLGRLSKEDSQGLKIEYNDQLNDVSSLNDSYVEPLAKVSNSVGKAFFASNRGKKYYSIGCSAGKTIKQENRIYFSTELDAQKAGYEKSTSCN